MKQVVQNYSTGELTVTDVPVPLCARRGVLVRTAYSLVSAGTERMKVAQARMSLLAKARTRPDKVRQVIDSLRQVGWRDTMQKVRERLDALTPLGYSLAGTVVEVGADVHDLQVGDQVACAGEGIACHAEYVSVPRNLCAPVPEGIVLQDAAFATVGAIALNGVRQSAVTLGESVLVVGLGLIGLLTVQILKAAGCRVIGVDVQPAKLDAARACGAQHAFARGAPQLNECIRRAAGGSGVDAVIVTASTRTADPLELAGRVLRDRGRVVVVGMLPIEADWQTYYRKELSVLVARSYGPGRYDPQYERNGVDYPIGYVRWTEGRNLAEFLRLTADGLVVPGRVGAQTWGIDDAAEAYQRLYDGEGRNVAAMLFKYADEAKSARRIALTRPSAPAKALGSVGIGLIGAGNFATATLLPALKRIPEVSLRGVCSARGLGARSAARRHGFQYCATDYHELLDDNRIHAVLVATRHDTHAHIAAECARAGKHVFVEKPLALGLGQLAELAEAERSADRIIMPGYNRRFSAAAMQVRQHFHAGLGPLHMLVRVNAGALDSDSWYADAGEGGPRLVSEGCHFVDLMQFLCDSLPVQVSAQRTGGEPVGDAADNATVTIRFENGALGTLMYVAMGDARVPKERVEVHGQGRSAVLDNFRLLELWFGGRGPVRRVRTEGKGHFEELRAFIHALQRGEPAPIAFSDAVRTTLTTLAAMESLRTQKPVAVDPDLLRQPEAPAHTVATTGGAA